MARPPGKPDSCPEVLVILVTAFAGLAYIASSALGLFGKKTPRTPAQNKAAKAKGDRNRVKRDQAARRIADKQAKKGKK